MPHGTHPEAEQVGEASPLHDPQRQTSGASNPSTGHALWSEYTDPHAPDPHDPQRNGESWNADCADSGAEGEPGSSHDIKVSGWAPDSIEKSSVNPFCGRRISAGAPSSGLADMVAMELQEAQHVLAKSHQYVVQLLSGGNSNMSSPAQPVRRSSHRLEPGHTAGDGSHHHFTTSIIAVGNSIIGKRRSSHRRSQDGSPKPKPVGYVSEEGDKPHTLTNKTSLKVQFELFPCWQGTYETHVSKAVKSGKVGRGEVGHVQSEKGAKLHRRGSNQSLHSIKTLVRDMKLEMCTIHPLSLRRSIWDVFSLAFVAYDIAFLPLQFFDLIEYKSIVLFMGWLTRIFWTCDIPISFFTGYLLQDGFITIDLHQIVFHYLTRWFLLDLITVGCDWAELVVRASDEQAGRTVQILQVIRLLRIARMNGIIKLFHFRITSEKFTVMADIAKILCFIITVAHLMACFWYGICNAEDTRETSWISTHHVEDSSMFYRYMMAMHWSLSQFQGGMDEVRPHNLKTRLFNVVAFLIAFMVAAVCVSGLTSSMTRLDILASDRSRKLSVLRKYLAQSCISDNLALRVQRNALHAMSEQERLMGEHKVELLAVISDPLRQELHFEMYSPVLEVHPFFDEYIQACPHVVQQICHRAVKTWLVSKGDTVFNMGEIPEFPQMYIICNGEFEYVHESGAVTELSSEDFISEPTLWIPWMHRGILHSLMDGRLFAMDARTFQHIACHSEHTEFDPKNYAQQYVTRLNDCQDRGLEISDLPLVAEETETTHAKRNSRHSWSSAVFDEVFRQTESFHQAGSQASGNRRRRSVLLETQSTTPSHRSSLAQRLSVSSAHGDDSLGIQHMRSTASSRRGSRRPRNSVLMTRAESQASNQSASRCLIPTL